MISHFPFLDYLWFYAVFTLFVIGLLALDLGVFHRKAHVVGFKEAATWSAIWVALALAFNVGLYFYCDWKFAQDPRLLAIPGFDPSAEAKLQALEFLTGYVVEKALSVDNIFVFAVVFSFFGIPAVYQHRVLFYGIFGALIFRALFITAGSILIRYEWVVLIFGVFLILTGIKILLSPDKPLNPAGNPLIRFLRSRLRVTPEFDGDRFFTRIKGVLFATPLFLALVFVEFSDIIFAIDSVPAIFAITDEPLIVFTSNVFAILGFRSLYFLLAQMADRFCYLKYGLGLVLVFVGLKMAWLNAAFGGKFPVTWSLGIIAVLIGTSMAASLLRRQQPPATPGNGAA